MPITYRRIVYFFLAAYAFTWFVWLGNWLLPSDNWPPMNPLGPLMAAPLVIWLTEGRAGLKAWLHRIARFRAPAWVYGAAFLIPLAIILSSIALTVATGATMRPFPEVELIGFLVMIPIILLNGPGPEEVSFRGHALPQLQQTMSPLAASLWIGFGVLVWHAPLILIGDLAWPWMITIVLVSIVYTWLYNIGGSVWPLVTLHFVVNYFGSEFIGAIVSDPQTQPIYAIIFCGFYVVWAALLIWRYGPALGRRPGTGPSAIPAHAVA
jgi:membrane protease YdiL (CAAX protease family)